MENRVGIVRDALYFAHSNGPDHPESPERLASIDGMLRSFPRRELLVELPARDALFAELALVHDEDYLRKLERTREHGPTMLDPDTSAGEHSYAAAMRAVGGCMVAAEAVLSGDVAGAFAFVRPPGHHAEAGRAMGFCLLNNVAIAAANLLRLRKAARILVVDWDVHHGNGTMHAFYDSDQVLYFSVHQFPHYPGTGRVDEVGSGAGKGFTVNVPLPGGQGDFEYLAVFQRILLPIAREYQPEIILVSAGFDIHQDDPLADMRVSSEGFGSLTRLLLQAAGFCCPGRLAFVLEGGYDLKGLSEGVSSVLNALVVGEIGDPTGLLPCSPSTETAIEAVRSAHAPFWGSLKNREK